MLYWCRLPVLVQGLKSSRLLISSSSSSCSFSSCSSSSSSFTSSSSSLQLFKFSKKPIKKISKNFLTSTTNSIMNQTNSNNQPNYIVPIKSISDKRDYRITTLNNGLKCILVSDPDTDKAAAALNVNVGHFADPAELPGLAHFLEHMLFLGTEKYPNESEYHQYLKSHGGSDNAATGMDYTYYYFDVHKDYLEEALDRFAQFFIGPLFTESATEREMNAVNSENQNNLQSDPHRLYQMDKLLAYPDHPFYKFGTGSIVTLRDNVPSNINVRKVLLDFYKEYYSASIMQLAVIGKEDLDKLTQYAEKMFSEIKNTERKVPEYSKEVFDPKHFPSLLKISPVKEKRDLTLAWPTEPCKWFFMERPVTLLAFCLGDEGPGSILALLKKLGYATELRAGLDYSTPQFGMIRVSISLTPEGLKNWERVVEIFYRYLAKMNEVTDERWLEYWEERKKVKSMGFAFKSKESPSGYATNLAQSLYLYPPEHLLECMSGLFFKHDIQLMKRFLKYINTDNCIIQLISKDFESECKEQEKWYGTLYQKVNLTSEQLNSWKNLKTSEDDKWLYTPPPNPFIAEDFSLFSEKHKKKESELTETKESNEKRLGEPPQVLVSTDQMRMWFKMDEHFKQPKLGVNFKIITPVASSSCINETMTRLLFLCFADVMSEFTYAFAEAGLGSSVHFDRIHGINVQFFGYNEKLPALVELVLSKLAHLELTQEQFNVNLERYKREIQSIRKSKAHQQMSLFHIHITERHGYTLEQLEEATDNVTYEKLMAHYEKLFDQIFVEGLIYGNAEEKQVADIYMDLVKKHILGNEKVKTYEWQDILAERKGVLKIPADGIAYTLRVENFNSQDNNSAIGNYYYLKIETPRDWSILKLLGQMISAPCFAQLRTKEQLGYLVWSTADIVHGLMVFRIIVQSVVADPEKLDERIEQFLQDFRKQLAETNLESFESTKQGVINDLLEKTKGIGQQLDQYWLEFENGRYQFERRPNVAKEVAKLSLEDVLALYDEYILGSKGTRCKLSVQCFGKDHKMSEINPEDAQKRGIHLLTLKDIPTLKEKYGFYPFPYTTATTTFHHQS